MSTAFEDSCQHKIVVLMQLFPSIFQETNEGNKEKLTVMTIFLTIFFKFIRDVGIVLIELLWVNSFHLRSLIFVDSVSKANLFYIERSLKHFFWVLFKPRRDSKTCSQNSFRACSVRKDKIKWILFSLPERLYPRIRIQNSFSVLIEF